MKHLEALCIAALGLALSGCSLVNPFGGNDSAPGSVEPATLTIPGPSAGSTDSASANGTSSGALGGPGLPGGGSSGPGLPGGGGTGGPGLPGGGAGSGPGSSGGSGSGHQGSAGPGGGVSDPSAGRGYSLQVGARQHGYTAGLRMPRGLRGLRTIRPYGTSFANPVSGGGPSVSGPNGGSQRVIFSGTDRTLYLGPSSPPGVQVPHSFGQGAGGGGIYYDPVKRIWIFQ